MRILITGAHGLLGRTLLRSAASEAEARMPMGMELVGCGRGCETVAGRRYVELDLLDPNQVHKIVAEIRPDWVVHTAAVTNVDLCETERDLARQVNVQAVHHLVAACHETEAGIVHLSTDYVFDGRDGPYSEVARPNPISHYGKLKLESERLIQESGIKALILRTLWLYGYIPAVRPNLVTWPIQALGRDRQSISVVDDQWGNATLVNDLAAGILDFCRLGTTGLLHIGGGDFMTRLELTRQLAEFFELSQELIEPTTTRQLAQVAPRPLRSGLRTDLSASILGRAPLGFLDGLQRMAANAEFLRDFSYLPLPS